MVFRRHAARECSSPSEFWSLTSVFCLSYLSPLPPISCTLFCAMEPSQPLYHQSLAHSFPCNGGGRVCVWDFARHSSVAASLCFQSLLTVKFRNSFALITIRIAGGGGTPSSSGVKAKLELSRKGPVVRRAKPDRKANVTLSGSTAPPQARSSWAHRGLLGLAQGPPLK